MPTDITQLDHPIDVMYLIHKAIRAEARRTRQAAEHLAIGGNFKPFLDDFYRWAMALGFHEEAEYQYVLPLVPDLPRARYNAGGHQALLAGLEDLQRCLHEELGHTIVIPRTQRQLVGKVIALLIAQADLLDEEEARLLPVIRLHVGEAEQLAMARHLLFDPESQDVYREIKRYFATATVRITQSDRGGKAVHPACFLCIPCQLFPCILNK